MDQLVGRLGDKPELYHVGLVVPDITAAVEQYRDLFGLRFASLRRTSLEVRVNGMVRTPELIVSYTIDGPPYVELIEELTGGTWAADTLGLNHIGLVGRLDGAVADSNPILHYVAAVLREHRPPPVPLALVHGDAQPTNILVPEQGPVLLIDWEFGRIGDPREDLGFYSYLPVPPNLCGADPQGFLARYRERSGFTEEQVNEDTASYFYILGQARLLGQQIDAADALTRGQPRGVMATYLISGISVTTRKFLEIARRLAEQR